MVVFTGLAATGLLYRRRANLHKRLLTLATIALLAAPIARLPFGAPLVGLLGDPVTLWGGLAIVFSQPLRLAISGTALWLRFAAWLTHAPEDDPALAPRQPAAGSGVLPERIETSG